MRLVPHTLEIGVPAGRYRKPIEYIIDENECWNCVSHRQDKYGRPKIQFNGKYTNMSRAIFSTVFTLVKDGECVCHSCDNPRCINPAHMFLGTQQDNVADRVAKGRTARHLGSKNGRAKLDIRDIEFIRKNEATMSRKELALQFNVSTTHIGYILRGMSWGYNL